MLAAARPPTEPWNVCALLGVAPEGEEAALWRLGNLAEDLPLDVDARIGFAGGNSNDAWLFPEVVLRVCWRGDRERFMREAAVLQTLPPGVPAPVVVDAGRTPEMAWILTRRVPGVPLEHAEDLAGTRRREVFRQHALTLRELHSWTPPTHVTELLREVDRSADGTSPSPKQLVPLPLRNALDVAERVAQLPFIDEALIDAAVDRLKSFEDADPFSQDHTTVVHGDPTWSNVLVKDGRLTALIDFEWVRFGPIDLELVVPIFMGFYLPEARRTLEWLEEDYPELFSAPDFDARMWLYQLSFALWGIMWWPPESAEAELNPAHPVHNLRLLVEGSMELTPSQCALRR